VSVWNRRFSEDLERLGIHYDLFDRTSSPENVSLVQEFFTKLSQKGYIFETEVDQLYCEFDKKFLPDRYVKGKCPYCGAEDQYSDGCENCGRTLRTGQILDAHCSICGRSPIVRKSMHYFFRLSTFGDELKKWLNENDNLQSDAKNYVLSWIKDGLRDWDITRDIDWGVPIPLPEARGKVLYGWFDNHLCYISTVLKLAKSEGKDGNDIWNSSTIYHFIGKDIVYHHYLFLPSMRMGEGDYKLPDFIPTRGHLLLQGKKISKSRHWMITIRSFLELFPPDYLRFYLTRIVPYSQSDADFNWQEFKDKVNNELVANIGNFVYRTLVFVKTKHGNVIPEPGKTGPDEDSIVEELGKAVKDVGELIEKGHYDRALKRILEFSASCNQYFQKKAPWQGGANESTAIFFSCNLVAGMATLLSPFLPFTSSQIWNQLGFTRVSQDQPWNSASNLRVKPHQRVVDPKPLFRKIEKGELESALKLIK
jgi:methionyl-tRNA synthetase